MACFWKALCECFQVFHFTKITNAIQYMVHCCITKQPEVDRISMWDKLLNDAAVIHVMLRAEGGSKIAFISCKRAGFLLSCSITVVNGAALLITVPVIAKYCSGKFSLTLETDLFTLTAMSFVERNSIFLGILCMFLFFLSHKLRIDHAVAQTDACSNVRPKNWKDFVDTCDTAITVTSTQGESKVFISRKTLCFLFGLQQSRTTAVLPDYRSEAC